MKNWNPTGAFAPDSYTRTMSVFAFRLKKNRLKFYDQGVMKGLGIGLTQSSLGHRLNGLRWVAIPITHTLFSHASWGRLLGLGYFARSRFRLWDQDSQSKWNWIRSSPQLPGYCGATWLYIEQKTLNQGCYHPTDLECESPHKSFAVFGGT